MIKRINLLKEIGRFSALNSTRDSEGDFSKLNVIYASNACGKSTLCDVFRSLDTDNPAYIIGRKRFGSNTEPEVVVLLEGGQTIRFQDSQCRNQVNQEPGTLFRNYNIVTSTAYLKQDLYRRFRRKLDYNIHHVLFSI